MNSPGSLLNRLFRFYYDGFRTMSWWGKKVWIIILIKLFVIFVILKLIFFQDFPGKKSRETGKSEYVLDQLINPK